MEESVVLAKTSGTYMKMSVTINNSHGNVDIATEVISTVVGASTTEIFGVVGMTSKAAVKDNFRSILRQENYSKGVVVTNTDNEISIDVYVVISYGVKISEVAKKTSKNAFDSIWKTNSEFPFQKSTFTYKM